MTCTWFRRILPVSVLVLPLLLGLSSEVAGQEQAKPEQTAEEKAKAEQAKVEQAEREGKVRVVEEVTVTGSLIPRLDVEALSPVAVINAEEVTYQGTGRVEDLVQALPQVFIAQNATVSNGASGTATVALRNLGAQRTLVLLNGKRLGGGDAQSAGADLNFIPSALVKRVDILTGGASAAYGADAVAGVVNFVLDPEFEGFRGEVSYNGFQHNNDNAIAQQLNVDRGYTAPSGSVWNHGGVNFNLAVGGKLDGGKGHASAFVDYRDIGAIRKDQRDYTNCSVNDLAPTGARCGGSSSWQNGRFISEFGDFVLDPNTGNTNTFRPREPTDVYNFAPPNFLQRNDRRWAGGGFARYHFSDKVEPYAEIMVMDDYSDAQIAESANFFNTETINCDNPMLSEQQRISICGTQTSGDAFLLIGRRNVEGGPRAEQISHVNARLLAGIRGDLNPSWHYDVYGLNASVSSPQTYVNDLSIARVQDSLLVVGTPGDPSTWRCRSGNPGCVPWNVFSVGGVTKAATDYLAIPLVLNSGTNAKYLGGTLRGDLESAGLKLPSASEGIQLAVGAWVSRTGVYIRPDETYQQGGATGQGGPTLPVDGHYVTKEAYGELRIPLVQDTTGAQDLALEFGYRFMNYKAQDQDAKNNSSYKAMLSWAPANGLRFRGGVNRSVRAPDIGELFTPQGLGLNGTEDICAGANPQFSFEQCARTGVTAAQYGRILENPAAQYNSLDGGNPLLNVEKADTITAGLVLTPKSISGLSVTLDYYDIKIKDTIEAFQPDDVVKACAAEGNPQLCNLIHRDRLGTLWITTDAYTIVTDQNLGERKVRGLDVTANYPWKLGNNGFIAWSFMGSTMLENRLTNPLVDYDCAGFMGNQCGNFQGPSPKWRHRLRASWNTNFKATFSLGWRYIASVKNDDFSDNPDLVGSETQQERLALAGSDKFPAFNWLDLAATYKVRDKLRLTVGCNNILDKEPPYGPGLSDIDYAAGYLGAYDPMGRAVYANMQFEF